MYGHDRMHSFILLLKCFKAKVLLSTLVEVAATDLNIAAYLLCIGGSYCKLVHIAEPLLLAFLLSPCSSLMRR